MEKQAGRYAGEGGIELRGGMTPSPGFGDMNRMSALFPMGNNSAIARQAQQTGMNQNPAAYPSAPQPVLADVNGILQAAQKVAAFSYANVLLDDLFPEKTARLNPLLTALDAILGHKKHAEVSTGQGNAGGQPSSGGPNSGSQASPRGNMGNFGTMPARGTPGRQKGMLLQQNAMNPGMLGGMYGQINPINRVQSPLNTVQSPLNVAQKGWQSPINRVQSPINVAQKGWQGLAPGSPSPTISPFFSKVAAMAVPGPAGLQPTPGLTAPGTPPPQPGMPPPGQPGSPAPGPVQGVPGAAPGAAPTDPSQQGAQQGAPPTPPTPPMSDAPPLPLPVNPRMTPPSPVMSPGQAQEHSTVQGLLDDKWRGEHDPTQHEVHSDMTMQKMVMAAARHAKKEDIEPDRMTAALHRLVGHDILEGKDRWMPRLFPNKHTPAKDMLADPLRNGILTGLLGAGVGGLAGYVGHQALGGSGVGGALGGAGVGGLGGFALGAGHRVNKNDEVVDKMRHLMPGATVGDMDALDKSGVDRFKTTFEKLADAMPPPPPPGMPPAAPAEPAPAQPAGPQAPKMPEQWHANPLIARQQQIDYLRQVKAYQDQVRAQAVQQARGQQREYQQFMAQRHQQRMAQLVAQKKQEIVQEQLRERRAAGGYRGPQTGSRPGMVNVSPGVTITPSNIKPSPSFAPPKPPVAGEAPKPPAVGEAPKPPVPAPKMGLDKRGGVVGSMLGGFKRLFSRFGPPPLPLSLPRAVPVRPGMATFALPHGSGQIAFKKPLGQVDPARAASAYYRRLVGQGMSHEQAMAHSVTLRNQIAQAGRQARPPKAGPGLMTKLFPEDVPHVPAARPAPRPLPSNYGAAPHADLSDDPLLEHMEALRSARLGKAGLDKLAVLGAPLPVKPAGAPRPLAPRPVHPAASPGAEGGLAQAGFDPTTDVRAVTPVDYVKQHSLAQLVRSGMDPRQAELAAGQLGDYTRQHAGESPESFVLNVKRMLGVVPVQVKEMLARQAEQAAQAQFHGQQTINPQTLGKQAAQRHDGSFAPKRSATGESSGLSFAHKSDDYAQGQEAWAAASRYFKGGGKKAREPDPFHGDHRGSEKKADLAGAVSTAARQGVNAAEHNPGLLKRIYGGISEGISDFFRRAPKPKLPVAPPPSPTAGAAHNILNRTVPNPVGRTMADRRAALSLARETPATDYVNQAARPRGFLNNFAGPHNPQLQAPVGFMGYARRGLGAAYSGYLGGVTTADATGGVGTDEEGNQLSTLNPFNWGGKEWAGAAAFAAPAAFKHQRWSQAVQPMLHRTQLGAVTGSGIDTAAARLGYDTNNRFGQLGAATGLASGLSQNRAFNLRRQQLAVNLQKRVRAGLLSPQQAEQFLQKAELGYASGLENMTSGHGPLWASSRRSLGGRIAQGVGDLHAGMTAPLHAVGRGIASVPRRLMGYSREELARNPSWWARKLHGWEGHDPLPVKGLRRGLFNVGRAATVLPVGVTGLVVGNQLLQNKVNDVASHAAANLYRDGMPMLQEDIADFLDDYMAQRGMTNPQGQFDPTGAMMHGLGGRVDNLLRSLGLNPAVMSPTQKALFLGGPLLAGGGAMMGHPLLAGVGGLAAMGGLAPLFAGQGVPHQPGFGNYALPGSAAPPNTPVARNEWEYQQRLNRS